MITQHQRDLRNAIVKHAEKANPDLDHITAALIRVLGSVIEGIPIEKAMGAPGDWGYGEPIGDALLAFLQAPDETTTLPTVHMNGTGIKTIRETYDAAAMALEDFIARWGQIEFNARDYYVDGPEAFTKAQDCREKQAANIRAIRQYLETHREHLYCQPG